MESQLQAKEKDNKRAILANAGDKKKIQIELDTLKKVHALVCEDQKDVRSGTWTAAEVEFINTLYLLTAKPVVYLCNLSIKDFSRKKNKWLAKIKQWIDANHPGDVLIPYSGSLEIELASLPDDSTREVLLKELVNFFVTSTSSK